MSHVLWIWDSMKNWFDFLRGNQRNGVFFVKAKDIIVLEMKYNFK